jgi:hypothetical protein
LCGLGDEPNDASTAREEARPPLGMESNAPAMRDGGAALAASAARDDMHTTARDMGARQLIGSRAPCVIATVDWRERGGYNVGGGAECYLGKKERGRERLE